MWFIFLVSCIAIALAAFLVIYIGHKVIQKIERDDKMSDVEQEIYEQVKKKDERRKAKAEADKAVTITNAQAEAEANRIISESITENLIKMTEAEARKKHGWITVQGADAVVSDEK